MVIPLSCPWRNSITADAEASRYDLILNAILNLGGRRLLMELVETLPPLLRFADITQKLIVRYTRTTSDLFLCMPPLFSPLAEAFSSSEALPTCHFILWTQRDARG